MYSYNESLKKKIIGAKLRGDQRLVQPWWLGGDFDPAEQESDECIRCGCSMWIRDGREPQDDPDLNVCDPCAQSLMAEMWSRLNS